MTATPATWRRTFPTVTAAVDYLKARGFSVGIMQADQPRGVVLGRVDIRKWRDLSAGDRLQLHGIVSTIESGSALVTIYGSAPGERACGDPGGREGGRGMTDLNSVADRRCGTCKRWRPKPKRDGILDRHYGSCSAPEPTLAACFTQLNRLDPSSIAGDTCPKWLAGGKHGALK